MGNKVGIGLGLTALVVSLYALLRRGPIKTKTGIYIGDESERQIKVGFKCSEVTILNNESSAIYILLPGKTNCQIGSTTRDVTNDVYLINDGFIVGGGITGANVLGITYHWWAISALEIAKAES